MNMVITHLVQVWPKNLKQNMAKAYKRCKRDSEEIENDIEKTARY